MRKINFTYIVPKKQLRSCLSIVMAAACVTGVRSLGQSSTAPHSVEASSDSITREQAADILKELHEIRSLLEAQTLQLSRISSHASPGNPESARLDVSESWHSLGKADAPVTVVEFADFQCPFCRRFQVENFPDFKREYVDSGQVKFVFRDLPLNAHAYARRAAESVRCAGDQNKYWDLHDALFASDEALSDDLVLRAAQKMGMNMVVFQSCIDSGKYAQDVSRDAEEAADQRIHGTPTFVVARTAKGRLDGAVIVGSAAYPSLQSKIEALLKGQGIPSTGAAR